jgi:uncharacterized SAM-binding protein YcdF (DUF218 family)
VKRIIKLVRSVRWRRLLVVTMLAWVWVIVFLLIVIDGYGRVDRAVASDVIVVLGAGLRADNTPSPAMYRRTAKAAQLWKDGIAPLIICSGGRPNNRMRSEADACRELLEANGVAREAIILEEQSRSTEENALHTRDLMQARGMSSAVVVSDGYHLLRALRLFRAEGIPVVTSPADGISTGNYARSISREVLAFHWQLFKEFFNLPVTYVPMI